MHYRNVFVCQGGCASLLSAAPRRKAEVLCGVTAALEDKPPSATAVWEGQSQYAYPQPAWESTWQRWSKPTLYASAQGAESLCSVHPQELPVLCHWEAENQRTEQLHREKPFDVECCHRLLNHLIHRCTESPFCGDTSMRAPLTMQNLRLQWVVRKGELSLDFGAKVYLWSPIWGDRWITHVDKRSAETN